MWELLIIKCTTLHTAGELRSPDSSFKLHASSMVNGKCKISAHTHPTHICQVTLVTQAHTNLQLKKSSGLPRLKTSTIEVLRCTPELEIGITKFLHMSVHEPTTSQETLTLHSSMKTGSKKIICPAS
jgi:hypothetical protein